MGSSTVLDLLGSAIIFGVLMLTVGRVQVNLNSTMYYNTYMYMTQNYALELSKMIEFDFAKIGYRVPTGAAQIDTADTNKITFRYRFPRTSDTIRLVRYRVGEADASSENPRDFILYRTEHLYRTGNLNQTIGTTSLTNRLGLTEFRLAYYDSTYRQLTTPLTTQQRIDSIYAIRVYYRVESLSPIIMPDGSQYISVIWEKLIHPRNLSAIR